MALVVSDWWLVTFCCVLFLLVLWVIPLLQLRPLRSLDPDKRFDKENEARKTLGQVIAGLAIVGAFYSGIQTLNATRTQISMAQEQLMVTKQSQLTERFAKAVTALGETSVETRVGGMFLLESAGIDALSVAQKWAPNEILSVYVRTHRRIAHPVQDASPSDIETALLILGRRDPHKDPDSYYISLDDCDLTGIDFQAGDFSNTSFENSDLRKAKLDGVTVDKDSSFVGCHLEGQDLEQINGMTREMVRQAITDAKTTLPRT